MKGMIGLEIHAYVITREKLFCQCVNSRERGLKPNSNICPICTGQPGAKPMAPNEEAVKNAVKIGLMLGCSINNAFFWQRKHYDWPDLPKGYQTTISGAHAVPLGVKGLFSGARVQSMHLEEDPASWDPETGCVDYNRSGLPLVEIVTEPDFTYSEEVVEWLKKLIHALSYLGIVDSNAGVKIDVNVNIPGKTERVEIKNISSLESVGKAIEYELQRQMKEGSVKETRRFDSGSGKTFSMRKKEGAADYRFISDPDLQLVTLEKTFIEPLRKELPESPEEKLKKLIVKYKIDEKSAAVLAKNLDVVEFFEKVSEKVDSKFALPWVTVELLRVLNWNKKSLSDVDIKSEHFVELLKLVRNGKITELQAKQVLNKFVPRSFKPEAVEGRLDDPSKIEAVAREVIKNNAKVVSDYKKGDEKALNFLMGEVMKKTNRRADFKIAREVLVGLLS